MSKRETLRDLVAGAGREPETVVVQNADAARLVGDRRALVGDAGAQAQVLVPVVLGASGEEPLVTIAQAEAEIGRPVTRLTIGGACRRDQFVHCTVR